MNASTFACMYAPLLLKTHMQFPSLKANATPKTRTRSPRPATLLSSPAHPKRVHATAVGLCVHWIGCTFTKLTQKTMKTPICTAPIHPKSKHQPLHHSHHQDLPKGVLPSNTQQNNTGMQLALNKTNIANAGSRQQPAVFKQLCMQHSQRWTPSLTRRGMLGGFVVMAVSAPGMASKAGDDIKQAPPITKVFVAGATGQTGQRVVQELRRRGIEVVAGVRSPEKAAALGFDKDAGIQIVRADVTEGVEPLKKALGDAQAVISALGYNGGSDPAGFVEVDSKGTINLIQAAKECGVQWFVLESSVLTGADKGGLVAKLAYAALNFGTNALARKKEAEAALKEAAASGGFSYTIVRPAALSNDPEDAVGVPYFEKEDAILGAQKVSRDSVAKLMVEAVSQQGPARNKTVEIAAKKGGKPVPAENWFP